MSKSNTRLRQVMIEKSCLIYTSHLFFSTQKIYYTKYMHMHALISFFESLSVLYSSSSTKISKDKMADLLPLYSSIPSPDFNHFLSIEYDIFWWDWLLCSQSGLGLSDVSGSYMDGIFTCRFTRKKHLPDEKQIFDLNNDYYMFFAHGEAVNGELPLIRLVHIR